MKKQRVKTGVQMAFSEVQYHRFLQLFTREPNLYPKVSKTLRKL